MGGLRKDDYLAMEKIFLNSLSLKQRNTLRKLNPYRAERNSLIRKLILRGVPVSLLARAAGMSWIQIYRIVKEDEK